jgi:hypothetical protein
VLNVVVNITRRLSILKLSGILLRPVVLMVMVLLSLRVA